MSRSDSPRDRLATSLREIFGHRCKAAWLSGSFAYGGVQSGHSDIDVMIVLNGAVHAPADEQTVGLIRQFVVDYVDLHAALGFRPDLDFPGEFLTEAIAEEAAEGRGLACDGGPGQLRILPVEDEEYWLDCPERSYRAWLSMIAFSRYLTGSRTYHSALKVRAWKTILRFILLRSPHQALSFAEVFNELRLFGFKDRYTAFRRLEKQWVNSALMELEGEGVLELVQERIVPRQERLAAWEHDLSCRLACGADFPPLLLNVQRTRELSAYASLAWMRRSG